MCDFAQNRAQSYTLLYNKTNNGVYFFFFYEFYHRMTATRTPPSIECSMREKHEFLLFDIKKKRVSFVLRSFFRNFAINMKKNSMILSTYTI